MQLSAIIIARNEEKKIGECIRSLNFCDEIIVIDSGSTDTTDRIAKTHGAVVHPYKSNNFSDLRNFGLKKAKGEWVLYIDADERVSKALQAAIKKEVSNAQHAAYKLRRKNYYFHTHEWPKIEMLERLFRRSKLIEWYGALHESPRVDGTIGTLEGYLFHFTHDDLGSMLKKTNTWSEVEAKMRYDTHHPPMSWWRFPRVMCSAFFASYITQGGWRAGTAGLVESIFQSFSMFVTYAKLWELQQKQHEKKG